MYLVHYSRTRLLYLKGFSVQIPMKIIYYFTYYKIITAIFMPLFSNANRVIEAVLEEMLMNHSSSFAALFQGHFCHIVTRTQNERTVRLLEATLLPTSIFLFRNSDL